MIRNWFLVNASFHLLFYDSGICTWSVKDMKADEKSMGYFIYPFKRIIHSRGTHGEGWPTLKVGICLKC